MSEEGCVPVSALQSTFTDREDKLRVHLNLSQHEEYDMQDPNKVVLGGCKAHHHAKCEEFLYENFQPHTEQVTMLTITNALDMKELPEDFSEVFVDMEQLEILTAQELKKLPSLSKLESLKTLTIEDTQMSTLPSDIGDCPSLQVISLLITIFHIMNMSCSSKYRM